MTPISRSPGLLPSAPRSNSRSSRERAGGHLTTFHAMRTILTTLVRPMLTALLALAILLPAPAQSPAPGYRLFSPQGINDAYLVDTNNAIVHTWTGAAGAGGAVYLEPDGTLLRTYTVSGGPGLGGAAGGIQRLGFDSSVLWDYQVADNAYWSHHDVERLPNGNVLMLAWERMTAAQAIAAGRDPALLTSGDWFPDAILEIRQTGLTTGAVVWEWHMMDHVVQDFDSSQANFGVVADHPELLDINFPPKVVSTGDWNHLNAVSYDPVRDLVVINSPFQEEFWCIDHSTTSAEAAGHTGGARGMGGDFVYRWGNPQAYRAGTPSDQKLFFQHGTHVIPQGLQGAGNILVFNNRAGTPAGLDYSAVEELQLPASFTPPPHGTAWGPSGPVWEYKAPVPTTFYSSNVSSARRLPNGNTLICKGNGGWLFEITSAGQMVWEYFPQVYTPPLVFMATYSDRGLWADHESLTASAGGSIHFDLEAGSARARHSYVIVGSMSGTTPGFDLGAFHVPLNIDGYTLGLLSSVGAGPFADWVGVFDAGGGASANLALPPLASLAGITLHHAYVTLHPTRGVVTYSSNAVPLSLQ